MPSEKISVRLAESAVADLQKMPIWYANQGVPDVGRRLISEIFQRVDMLEEHPDAGRIVPEFDQPFLRELIQPPFRIVYRHDPGKVYIVRIWRSERLLRLPQDS